MNYQILVDLDANEKYRSKPRKWRENTKIYLQTKLLRRPRSRSILLLFFVTFLIFYATGLLCKPFEKSFSDFTYPVHRDNFRELVQAVQAKSRMPNFDSSFRSIYNRSEFQFIHNPAAKCKHHISSLSSSSSPLSPSSVDNNNEKYPKTISQPVDLLIVVKSAVCNFHFRNAIRQTWGSEQRFIDINIKTVFMLGECSPSQLKCTDPGSDNSGTVKYPSWLKELENSGTFKCSDLIERESQQYSDLIVANFHDNYYNNTLKTIACFQWVTESCGDIPYIFFVDDDYFVSIKNLLNFMKNFLEFTSLPGPTDYDGEVYMPEVLYDGRLYAGWVYPNSWPQRSIFSKWSIPLADYPYTRYPPYITGGAFLMNNRTVSDIYFASLYTKRFEFDDVYLGILAWKMQIRLVHNSEMKCSRHEPQNDHRLIASHGFKDPEEMAKIWFEQKAQGLA